MKAKYWLFNYCIGLSLLCGCTALVTKEHHSNTNGLQKIHSGKEKSFPKSGKKISTTIMGKGGLSSTTMKQVLKKHHSELKDTKIHTIIESYIDECHIEGVNHDIAFAQMCLETDYLKYGGQVSASQNNFAGLGALDGGAKGLKFRSLQDGVRAHVQHLKAYASQEPLKNRCIDPRFRFVKRGSAKTIYELTGKWASDPNYGNKIKNQIIAFYKLQSKNN
jgi:hypothetical protein